MELAAALGAPQPSSVSVAAISAVFTIGYVANLLGENEDWLYDLSIDMFPEDGCLYVYGIGEDWRHRLHQIRNRVPETNHRRATSRRTPAAQARKIK